MVPLRSSFCWNMFSVKSGQLPEQLELSYYMCFNYPLFTSTSPSISTITWEFGYELLEDYIPSIAFDLYDS